MGQALQKAGWPRDSYIVSSKVMWGSVDNPKPTQRGLHRKHVFDACHDALRRLQVEYLDLYFCHRPDINVPMEEVVRMMTELIHQGKVLYWGTSQWSAQQLSEAYGVARQYQLIPPTMEQPQYSMFHREKVEAEFAPLYDTIGLGTTTFSPLYFGILTGKYNDGIPADSRASLPGYEWVRENVESERGQQQIAKVRQLMPIAEGLGATMSQLAIAWCLRNPRVSTVILGASRVSQVHENLKALDVLPQLTDDVMTAIEDVLGNKPPQPEAY